ncbi:hypothetical protein ASJ35_17300 [Ruthenibacterium lactatiformans]|uniref:Uncharacterized protein n=1 Tax=Ruthenibacterium lactatiformans TaxID=1550024 RepID=A0A0W7TLS2_9FIRM|nr:hypothetical protein [Ruthenibacterium lactatiformans]KUE74791.1 hypothetical protein ASJ35_17300 [Ruthenibacterium lactatiformans]MBN3007471.1 hypothetical protein [Ruthenibacterium lactatiformans]
MAKRNPQYDWLDAPLKNTWELENTAKKKLYDANIFQQLYPNPAPTAAPQKPKTGGLDTGSGWKGFGVNNPDETDWKENAPANLVELTTAQPSQPQPITHQVSQTAPVDLSKMTEAEKIAYANDLLTQLNWQATPDVQQKNASVQGAGGSFSRTGAGRNDARLLGEKSPSASLLDKAGEFATKTLYDLSEGVANVLDFLTDPQKVNNLLYSDFVKDNVMAGLSGFNRSVAQTADFILPDVITVKPVQDVLNFYKNDGSGYEARAAATNQELEMETPGSLFQSAVQALPNAVLTLMSGGASDAAQLGGASGSTVSNVIQEAMKNPSFWSSFMRTAGASYEDAKASGANELAATVYGITNGLVSSGIEVGGGVEGMLDKNGLGGILQTMYEEGSEEVKQNVIANLLAKILYNQDAEYFSMTDENAVFNPEREIKAFGGGAAIGGLFGGGNMILNSTRPTYDISQIYQYNTDSETGNAAQPIATGTEASVPSMADMFPLSNKTPVQSETDALVNAFYNNTLTNAQIETLKPGGKNRAAFEAATGLTLPETSTKTRALLKLGAEESIDGTLKTEYNGVSGGVQNGTANPASASVASGEGIPLERKGFGSDSNVASGRQYTGGNRGTVSFLTNDAITSDALSRVGSAYVDMHDTTAQPQVFTAALDDAIKANKHGLMVSPKTPQELADSGAVTFMTNDGLAGAAVTADGDIEAVFKNPTSQIKRASAPLMLNAIENGGRKLDCYGIGLVNNYNTFGFEPVARVVWNPEYAPEGWTYGPKDVYVMKLSDGVDAAAVKARLGLKESEGGFHAWTQPELDALPEMDYDEALAYRDSLLEQGAKPVAERVDGAASSVSARVQPNARAQTQNAPEIPSGMKERGFAESLRTKSDLPTEVKQEFIDNPELYKSLSNETTVARAEEIFARGETEARNAFSDMLKTADPAAVPLGKMIADDLIAKGDRAGAVNVLRDMSAALTRSGQFSQAAVIALTKADPMTALQYIQRQVDTMNAAGAKKFGRKWNDFELADAEIDAFKNIDPGDTQAVETAMENVGKRISKEYPATVYEKLLELRRIGMLLNPRTMVRNTLANAAMMPVQGASGKVSALIQDITHRINPDFTPTQALHVSKESKTLASQVADNMRSVLSGDTKYYEFQGQGAGAKGQNALNDLNQYARDKTIFKGEIKSDWLSQLVDKTAYELNKVSQKTAQQDLFSGMTSEKGILENTRQLTYGLLELGDAGFVDKFFRDRLASYIEARGIKSVNDVPPEAITTALDEAMKATFKDDNALTEMLSSIKRSTNRVGGMGNFLLTFTKTPANIAMRIADYSPAGLISAAAKHVKGQTDAAQFIDDISKGLTGTGLMVLGAQLFKAGILTGPESDDKDEAAFMRTQGFKPNAVHVGDKYYTVDWAQPAASSLMMGAAIMAELEKNPDASFADASVAAGKTALNTWIEASPVKSIEDLFSSYEGLPGGVAELVQEIPGSFIPSTVGATARTVDPVQRQTYSKGDWLGTLFGGMQAKIPGASKSLPAAYDTWGRPITRQNSTGEAAFAQFVSPGTLGNANESPIDNVILELFQDTGNNKVFPRKAGWSVTVDGESKSLTNREYSDYQREMGQMSYNIAEYLVPKFDNLTDEQKVSVLDNAYSMAKDVAENELFGADLSRTTEKRMEEASALDGTQYANWAEILFAHAIIKDVTGDKVPGTDRTISGSAKKNKIAALVDAGYSQYQAMQLYDLLNG